MMSLVIREGKCMCRLASSTLTVSYKGGILNTLPSFLEALRGDR